MRRFSRTLNTNESGFDANIILFLSYIIHYIILFLSYIIHYIILVID